LIAPVEGTIATTLEGDLLSVHVQPRDDVVAAGALALELVDDRALLQRRAGQHAVAVRLEAGAPVGGVVVAERGLEQLPKGVLALVGAVASPHGVGEDRGSVAGEDRAALDALRLVTGNSVLGVRLQRARLEDRPA
jgi:hypothetical protein